MFIGKVVGAVLGFLAAGFFGAVLGLLVGAVFDRAFTAFQAAESPEQLEEVQQIFFRTVFRLIGHIAKADGRVSEEEIQQTETLMQQWGLTADHKREAIRLFKEGSGADFDFQGTVREFRKVSERRPQLSRMLMVYLFNTALVDGVFDQAEERVLRDMAEALGYSRLAFDQLLRMLRAQGNFRGGHYRGGHYQGGYQDRSATDELAAAYDALGVTAESSDAEVKKAYRKLMGQYHPDRLMGQGVPDDMLKAATERSQEVQAAYDAIKKARKK